jgi:hypothetical protein
MPQTFVFSFFSDSVLSSCPHYDSPNYTSQVAGITSMYHCAWKKLFFIATYYIVQNEGFHHLFLYFQYQFLSCVDTELDNGGENNSSQVMFENELFCLCDLNVITKYP